MHDENTPATLFYKWDCLPDYMRYKLIYILCPTEQEALSVFFVRFGVNPHRWSGLEATPDFAVEYGTIGSLSKRERAIFRHEVEDLGSKKDYDTIVGYRSIMDHAARPDVRIIADATPEEMNAYPGKLPIQGYVWWDDKKYGEV